MCTQKNRLIIPFRNVKKKIILNHPKLCNCNYGICSKGPKNKFETAVVNEPSVFEPLKQQIEGNCEKRSKKVPGHFYYFFSIVVEFMQQQRSLSMH